MRKVVLFLILSFFISCNQQKDPKALVRDFVKASFDHSGQHDDLKKYLTADFFNSISQNEEYNKQKINAELVSYSEVQSSCQDTKCSVMYVVVFNQKDSDKISRVEVKKQAQVVKIEENWLISDVQNLKTFIEVKEPISIQTN